jgi:hypothetical protein
LLFSEQIIASLLIEVTMDISRFLLTLLAALSILAASRADAQTAESQPQWTVSAGPAISDGAGTAGVDLGFMLGASRGLGGGPNHGLRIDALVTRFSYEAEYYGWGSVPRPERAEYFNLGLFVNYFVVLSRPPLRPYAITGLGMVRRTADTLVEVKNPYGHNVEISEGSTVTGVSGGLGVHADRRAVVELRYNTTMPRMSGGSFVSLSLGIRL